MDGVKVLDHGYLKLVTVWGSDESIVEAARMSTGKGFLGWGVEETCEGCDGAGTGTKMLGHGPGSLCPKCRGRKVFVNKPGDEKLLRYLYENKHLTPFEMAGCIVEVQAPIFVFREWHRHRTQSYNEMSARYMPLPDVNYLPTADRLMVNAGAGNKQAGTVKGAEALTGVNADVFRDALERSYSAAETLYQDALAYGVPKELARLVLPVARYSRMRASACLRNWLAFLTLREDSHAQWEIRQYAIEMKLLLMQHFPRTLALFMEGQR
jgi:thymidylate synthase (FAD)